MKIQYESIDGINGLQKSIMVFVEDWIHKRKTIVPQKEIISAMKGQKIPISTTINACHLLIKKGYIRRAVVSSNKTFYVLLKTILI